MNTKNEKNAVNDTELESVTGGNAPALPATQLASSAYSGMFANPEGPDQKEIHIYEGKVEDPSSFQSNF